MTERCHKKTKKIIVLSLMVFVFLGVFTPPKTQSASLINWKNPNADGGGPFTLTSDNIIDIVINEGLITQVLGCTGVIDKVAGALYNIEEFGKLLLSRPKEAVNRILGDKLMGRICTVADATGETTAGSATTLTLPNGIDKLVDCGAWERTVKDEDAANASKDIKKEMEKDSFFTNCLGGIAYRLAKNQLTSMARSTMNWISAGLDGNPFFVQSARSALNSVERNVIEPAIDGLADNAFPYGDYFSQVYINRFRNNSGTTSNRSILSSLASNMADYIIVDYRYNDKLSPEENKKAMEKKAVDKFSQDFSSGGWDGWASMILKDKNNPLGFYSAASRIISTEVEKATQDFRSEIEQGSGYASQKECALWQRYTEEGEPVIINGKYDFYEGKKKDDYDDCQLYKVITPGSNIKEQVDQMLETPVRQLELADNINDVLNSVFSVLLYAVQNQGLPGLTSGDYTYAQDSAVVSSFSNEVVGSSNTSSNNYSSDGSFNITRDLGNTFIYNYASDSNLGDWNADTNTIKIRPSGDCFDSEGMITTCPTKLIKGKAPYCKGTDAGEDYYVTCPANVYYVVSEAGKTDIAQNGYGGWAVGDRAFWNGSSWQNWKKDQENPIKKRGVLQLQEDYAAAATDILTILPSIMPQMGELDYCIPGPNPSWKINASKAQVPLIEIAASVNSDYTSSGTRIERESSWKYFFPDKEHELYINYQNNFLDLDGNLVFERFRGVVGGVENDGGTFKWLELKIPSRFQIDKRQDKQLTDKWSASERRADRLVNSLTGNIAKEARVFYEKYEEIINKNFGKDSIFWQEFIEYEHTAQLKENPAFIPMIKAGSEITSGMLFYDEEIKEATKKYEDGIREASSNIYKLSEIKNEVSEIIEAAQKRRTNKMIEKIKEEEGLTIFTEEDFNARYEKCLAEEDVSFYEDLKILTGTENDAKRCDDGIDNDRDGFIDDNDTDCNGIIPGRDSFNSGEGFGSLAEPGEYATGHNTRTNEEEYNAPDEDDLESLDLTSEIEFGKIAKCDNTQTGGCKIGNLYDGENGIERTSVLAKWYCIPESQQEFNFNQLKEDLNVLLEGGNKQAYADLLEEYANYLPCFSGGPCFKNQEECRQTLIEVTREGKTKAFWDFTTTLLKGKIDWAALEYMQAYYAETGEDNLNAVQRIFSEYVVDFALGARNTMANISGIIGMFTGLIELLIPGGIATLFTLI